MSLRDLKLSNTKSLKPSYSPTLQPSNPQTPQTVMPSNDKSLKPSNPQTLKLLISAYACEPGLGSEIGVGWHWVLELAKEFEVWVLTRESNRARIESYFSHIPPSEDQGCCIPPSGAKGLPSNLHFVYFDLPKWVRFWKKGLRGVRTYYNLWTRLSNPLVKKIMKENDIKVFHHITYGNALWQVSKYGSSQKFIWGPIGGLETIPEEYTTHYDSKSRWIEKIRKIVITRAVKSRSLKKRCERANLILCKTEDTLAKLPIRDKSKAILFTDVACSTPTLPTIISNSLYSTSNTLSLLCVGRLDAWRGFDLAILAVSEVVRKDKSLKLNLKIVGKGADLPRLKLLVEKNNLQESVTFTGQVSSEEYQKLMAETDVILNPSLKEGAVTVSFDAMAIGKPLIALDTGGYTRYFKPEYSIVIPRKGREETIGALADAIVSLTDEKKRIAMGKKAKEAALSFSWENHGKEIRETISRLL